MKLATSLAVIVLLASISTVRAQVPDESEVVKKRDWEGMVKIAEAALVAKDTDLAKRKFQEAWSYASFWAVYNPANRDSGSKRDYGIKGMEKIRTVGAGIGLDDTFREFDAIRAENPPKVFSGGKSNTGLWHVENDEFFTLKQNGGLVTGTCEITFPDGEVAVMKFEGKGFDGTKMQVEISTPGNPRAGRLIGELTLTGNRLAGKFKNPAGNGTEIEWSIDRAWRE